MEVLAPVRDASLPIPQRPNPQRPNPQRWVGLEAWGVLHPRVKDFAGAKLADPLLELVFAHSPLAGGFPCRRDAVVALGRRFRACKREGLGVVERPEGGEVFGIYATGHPDEGARPYRTHLRSVSPLEGSCDCRDFRCNSLGVCKHLLAVLRDLVGRPRLWQRAISQGAAPLDLHARLTWSPARPWDGAGDWLERVILVAGHGPLSPDEHDLIEAWLRPVGNPADLRWTPRAVFADEPARRLELTRLLLDHATWPSCYAGERHLPDPALVALLSAEVSRLELLLASSVAPDELERALASLEQPLLDYQREGVARVLASGRLLLADDMGLGKTVQAIASCHVLHRLGRVRRGLVIVPSSLKPQWLREWRSFSDAPVRVVTGSPAQRAALYRDTQEGFLIVNYALVRRDAQLLEAWEPDVVVLDEAQRIKNWETQTAHAVKRLQPPWRLALSGTPLENNLSELASLMDWIDESALAPRWRLGTCFTLRGEEQGGAPLGATNLHTLRERLAPTVLRRTRAEVLDQLPPRTDEVIGVSMTARQRQAHAAMEPSIAALGRVQQERPLTREEFFRLMGLLANQRVISNGMAQHAFEEVWPLIEGLETVNDETLDWLESPKLTALRDLVEGLLQSDEKVVIFSEWRRMLTLVHWALGDVLARADRRAVYFTGRESQRQRCHNVVDFHDDPRTAVLLATDAGGVGLNLQRASACCVNVELPWNPAVLEQRIARVHRLGQQEPVQVFNLISRGGIEERVANGLSAKAALFEAVFAGEDDEALFDRVPDLLAALYPDLLSEAAAEPFDVVAEQAGEEVGVCESAGESATPQTSLEEPAVEEVAVEEPAGAATEREENAGPVDVRVLVGGAGGRNEERPTSFADSEASPRPASAAELLQRFAVTQAPSGDLRLEGPPEAMNELLGLVEGLVQLLRPA